MKQNQISKLYEKQLLKIAALEKWHSKGYKCHPKIFFYTKVTYFDEHLPYTVN